MAELWYRLRQLPDLTLNKYTSLEGVGVSAVLDKHIAFLRQLNRKGIVSGLSFHMFYLYLSPEDVTKDLPGHRLNIFLLVKGEPESLRNVPALMKASPLADFYVFESKILIGNNEGVEQPSVPNILRLKELDIPQFNVCSVLTKEETLLPASMGDTEEYYLIRDWEVNEEGRLYNMCKMMEALNKTSLYRVDLYPVEKSASLRESLRKPISILRKRQDERGSVGRRDYDGKDVLDNYIKIIDKYDSSPHFIANIMVFADTREDAISILDAAGAESLLKGKYSITSFYSKFSPMSFLQKGFEPFENIREKMVLKEGRSGFVVCREDTASINLNYLPTLFTLEEIAPLFRLPALYDGETVQMPKETAPGTINKNGSLFLGKDKNGYDVYLPLELLPKHAFISGVPGSGKTNSMHHITASLWKEHNIPFLILEPAKKEYRALLNDRSMWTRAEKFCQDVQETVGLHLFSPNADMSFPLHINPFEMPVGTLVAEHIRSLCAVFEGAFPFEPPAPFILDTSIEAVYRKLGWLPEHRYTGKEKNKDGSRKSLPTLSMLYNQFEQELEATSYPEETKGGLRSVLQVRIGSLTRREMGDVFDVPESTFPPEKWLEVPAIVELESMGTGPANFLTLMLCTLIRETLKVHPQYDGVVRHVIFFEEAHNLIGPESEEKTGVDADPKQAATAFVVKMLAEVRALKEGIVIADQLPTVMAQEVLKNTGTKIGLKITSADDRTLLGSTMAASALQLEQMSTFDIGEALISYEKLMKPFAMRVAKYNGDATFKNDEELRAVLCQNAQYHDDNLASIRIIGKKYYYLFLEMEKKVGERIYWYDTLLLQQSKIDQLVNYLERVEMGEIEISNTDKELKYDQLNSLMISQETLVGDRTKDQETTDLIKDAGEWVFALERLKAGRWARFGAPQVELMKISLLQVQIADTVFGLYKRAMDAVGVTPLFKSIKENMYELEKLTKCLNNMLRKYIEENGDTALSD